MYGSGGCVLYVIDGFNFKYCFVINGENGRVFDGKCIDIIDNRVY